MTPKLSRLILAALVGTFWLSACKSSGPDELSQRIQRVESEWVEKLKANPLLTVGVAVIDDWKVEWARGYGAAKKDTLFQAASISKPVTAMAVMRLVEEEQLDLDQDVNEKLAGWKIAENEHTKKEKVTLRRLLSHSAGLTVHGFPGYPPGEPVPTLVQVLDGKEPANTDPVRVDLAPGSQWRYSGGGYCAIQQLLVDVTGKEFPALMREMVLDPLGMKDSTYQQPLPENLEKRAATGLLITGIPVKGKWHTYPEMAAAGLWTTPEDLARFVVELLKPGRVLSKETTRKMLTVVKGGYGLGISVQGKDKSLLISHGGNNAGYSCFLVGFTKTGQGAVVMTNSDAGNPLIQEILQRLAKEYGWPSK
jgi:CubicO group peptidase (beta-lactamase class C family)